MKYTPNFVTWKFKQSSTNENIEHSVTATIFHHEGDLIKYEDFVKNEGDDCIVFIVHFFHDMVENKDIFLTCIKTKESTYTESEFIVNGNYYAKFVYPKKIVPKVDYMCIYLNNAMGIVFENTEIFSSEKFVISLFPAGTFNF